jgi:4-amino-4-deoxy-L-arabinose transferase-like glycosyltransferase
MTEALYTFLNTSAVFLMVLGLRRPGWWPWFGVGVAVGLGALTRSAGQIVLVVVPVMLLLVTRSWRQTVARTALAVAAFAVITVPWMLRNQAVHGAFTTAGAAGQNLVTYTAIIHRGQFSFEDPLVVAVDADPKMREARLIVQQNMEDKINRPNKDVTGLGIFNRIRDETRWSETRADNAMREIAVRAILSRPLVYLRNTLEDAWEIAVADDSSVDATLRYHWDLWQSRNWRGPLSRYVGPATPEQEAAFDRLAVVDGLYHPKQLAVPLVFLFLVGTSLAFLNPAWRPVLAVAFVVLGLLFAHAAVVGTVPRYRNPLDPLINVVAMGALVLGVRGLIGRVRAARA